MLTKNKKHRQELVLMRTSNIMQLQYVVVGIRIEAAAALSHVIVTSFDLSLHTKTLI